MKPSVLRAALAAPLLIALAAPAAAEGVRKATPEQPSATWDDLRGDLFGERDLGDGAGMIALDLPYRAEDAAIVPVGISIDPGLGHRVTAMTLVIDENPAPVAAEFEFGEGMGPVIELSARIRVNAYSNVRVIAELDDGSLWQHALFVKASGGCSAPALKDMDAALASLGQIRMRLFDTATAADRRPEAQVMVRHPNSSGFQLDPATNLYIPAHFVDELEVRQGEEVLLRMVGGISISEDPTLRFSYRPDGSESLTVRAIDTDGGVFEAEFEAAPPS